MSSVYTRGPVYPISVCPVCHLCSQCTLPVYVQYTLATLSLGLGNHEVQTFILLIITNSQIQIFVAPWQMIEEMRYHAFGLRKSPSTVSLNSKKENKEAKEMESLWALFSTFFLSVFCYFLKCRKWHIDLYWSQTELCSKTLLMCPYWVIRLNSCTVQSWQLLNDHQFDTRFSLLSYYPCICIIRSLVNSYMFLCVCVFPPRLLIPFDKISYHIHTICFMWPCEWLIGHWEQSWFLF